MKSARRIDEILTSPWALWTISVATALLMWFYVTENDEGVYVTQKFSSPLEYRFLDSQLMLRSRVAEVDVEIRGPEKAMARLDYGLVSCFVDAKNLVGGIRYTQNVNVSLPPDITLVSCVPSQVVVEPVRQASRRMSVEVVLPQDIPEGQYLEGVEVLPKEVTVRGSEGDIAKVGALQVMPTVAELQLGKELLLPVKFVQSEPFEDSVVLEPSQARVRGALVRGLPKKMVPINARLSGNPDRDHEVKSVLTDPLEAQVEGRSSVLAKITAVDTETVDISLLSADQTLIVPLRAPKGAELSGVKSVRLTVTLGELKAGKQLTNVPVQIRGSEADQWVVSPSSASVVIEGTPSRVEEVTPESVGLNLYVDLSSIFITPADLALRAEVASADFRVIKIEPSTVTVNAAENLKRW